MEPDNTVTPEDVAEQMKNYQTQTINLCGKPVTVVALSMSNGFVLVETATCVDPANYLQAIGEKVCLKKIEDKVWMLLGYSKQNECCPVK